MAAVHWLATLAAFVAVLFFVVGSAYPAILVSKSSSGISPTSYLGWWMTCDTTTINHYASCPITCDPDDSTSNGTTACKKISAARGWGLLAILGACLALAALENNQEPDPAKKREWNGTVNKIAGIFCALAALSGLIAMSITANVYNTESGFTTNYNLGGSFALVTVGWVVSGAAAGLFFMPVTPAA